MHAIRRYRNRKLYDLSTSSYITMKDVLAIAAQEDIEILDQASGRDITARTLALALASDLRYIHDPAIKHKLIALVRSLPARPEVTGSKTGNGSGGGSGASGGGDESGSGSGDESDDDDEEEEDGEV